MPPERVAGPPQLVERFAGRRPAAGSGPPGAAATSPTCGCAGRPTRRGTAARGPGAGGARVARERPGAAQRRGQPAQPVADEVGVRRERRCRRHRTSGAVASGGPVEEGPGQGHPRRRPSAATWWTTTISGEPLPRQAVHDLGPPQRPVERERPDDPVGRPGPTGRLPRGRVARLDVPVGVERRVGRPHRHPLAEPGPDHPPAQGLDAGGPGRRAPAGPAARRACRRPGGTAGRRTRPSRAIWKGVNRSATQALTSSSMRSRVSATRAPCWPPGRQRQGPTVPARCTADSMAPAGRGDRGHRCSCHVTADPTRENP